MNFLLNTGTDIKSIMPRVCVRETSSHGLSDLLTELVLSESQDLQQMIGQRAWRSRAGYSLNLNKSHQFTLVDISSVFKQPTTLFRFNCGTKGPSSVQPSESSPRTRACRDFWLSSPCCLSSLPYRGENATGKPSLSDD